MNSEIFKRLLLAAMALLLVGIWTRNLFLFLPSEDAGAVPSEANSIASDSAMTIPPVKAEDVVFSPLGRDPFAIPQRQDKRISRQPLLPNRASPSKEMLRASLQGFVWENKSPCVIAFDSLLGVSSIYRLGDSIAQFELIQVTKSRAVWKSQSGGKIVWTVSE